MKGGEAKVSINPDVVTSLGSSANTVENLGTMKVNVGRSRKTQARIEPYHGRRYF